jgi:hypothetical protein
MIHMRTQKFSFEILPAAIEGFEQQKTRIDAQIDELRALLSAGRTESATTPEAPKGKRRMMSAAARKRIGDAQRKRWAKASAQPEPLSAPVTPEPSKPKRRLSEAGKAAIIAATKKRWAAKRAAAKPEPVAAKKVVTKKAAVKAAPPKMKKVAPKAAVRKAAPRKSAPAKAPKAPLKKAAKKSSSVTPQPTLAAGSVPAPEVAAQ